jgi:hypothetical protein
VTSSPGPETMVGPWLEDPTPMKLAELIERRLRSAKDV